MLHYKEYKTYIEYEEDQAVKIRLRKDDILAKADRRFEDFRDRFEEFIDEIGRDSKVLCLGARLGEEVRTFRSWGCDAIGIDLAIEVEDLVVKGDWNNLPFGNETFDVVYTNSIDHASDLQVMVNQIKKVLRFGGKVIIDLAKKHAISNDKIKIQFANKNRHESLLWNNAKDVVEVFEGNGFKIKKEWNVGRWKTYLMKK